MRVALVEARAVILTVASQAMILDHDYDPSQHPVIKQIGRSETWRPGEPSEGWKSR